MLTLEIAGRIRPSWQRNALREDQGAVTYGCPGPPIFGLRPLEVTRCHTPLHDAEDFSYQRDGAPRRQSKSELGKYADCGPAAARLSC